MKAGPLRDPGTGSPPPGCQTGKVRGRETCGTPSASPPHCPDLNVNFQLVLMSSHGDAGGWNLWLAGCSFPLRGSEVGGVVQAGTLDVELAADFLEVKPGTSQPSSGE